MSICKGSPKTYTLARENGLDATGLHQWQMARVWHMTTGATSLGELRSGVVVNIAKKINAVFFDIGSRAMDMAQRISPDPIMLQSFVNHLAILWRFFSAKP